MRRLALIAAAFALVSAPADAQCLENGIPCQQAADIAKAVASIASPQWVDQADVTLDASGNGTWTFDPSHPPPIVPAVVHLVKAMDTTNPIICNYTSVTKTGVTIHCWRTTLLGLLNSLFTGSVAGAQVNLVARAIP